jgi:Zn finger protein HypA/HybF involved in hydrogenase expression
MKVSLGEFVMILCGLGVAAVSVGWLLTNLLIRRQEVERLRGVIQCRICSVRYEAPEGQVTPCPACQTPNENAPSDQI